MFSVVIPAYNEALGIGLCIRAIQEELDTLGYPSEIIVVDNNSTDHTAEVAQVHGAKVVHEAQKGVTRARQKGLEAAKYDVVAFVDADNILPSGWIDYALEAFKSPDVVAVSGPVIYHELPLHQRILTAIFYTLAKPLTYFMPMLQGGNFVLRKGAAQRAGGFDTSIEFWGEDTAMAIRMAKVGRVVFWPDMYCFSSARRMEREGLVATGMRYMMNFFWMNWFGRPFSQPEYQDHR